MFEVRFVDNPVYVNFYFLLEIAGIPWLPAPHAGLIESCSFGSPDVRAAIGRLRTAPRLQLAENVDQIFVHAIGLRSDAQLASFLSEDFAAAGVERPPIELVAESASARASLVSPADVWAVVGTLRDLEQLLRDPKTEGLLRRLRSFFELGDTTLLLDVIPYPLAAACDVSFGSLTGSLLTLGIHPHSTPERSLGIIVHEAVHSWAASLRGEAGENAFALPVVEEALATVIGNAWMVGELTGRPPGYPWYDDPSVDRVARQLYETVSRAIERGQSFNEIVGELAEIAIAGARPPE